MKKSEKTREKIIESSILLLADKGYTGTSTKEIAAKAGISEASIFRYFASKDELLMAIVRESINEIYDNSIDNVMPIMESAANLSTRQLLYRLLIERFSFLNANSNRVKIIFQEMLVNSEVRIFFKEKVWAKLDEVSRLILQKGVDSGEFRQVKPYFFQKLLFGMMFHTGIFENVIGLDPGAYSIEEQAENIIDMVFNGIGRA